LNLEKVEVKIVKQADIKQLMAIYKNAGWWNEKNDSVDPEFIQRIIDGSFCFAVAIYKDKIIGMGRSISDGCSDAYIQDVAVLSKYRRKGIGVLIMDEIIHFLKMHNIGWIGLVSEPRAVNFYERYGFYKMNEYIPYLYP